MIRHQICISLSDESHKQVLNIIEKTGLKKIEIFKIGIQEVENSLKQGSKNAQ